MRAVHLVCLVVLGLATLPAATAIAEDKPPVLTITGNGAVSAAPDLATINTAVETAAPTAAEALSENSALMTEVFTVLTDAGMAMADIQTNQLSVRPEYRDLPGTTPRRTEIYQYRVTNGVLITVRDLDRLGTILDQIVQTGVNQINSVGFGHSTPAPLLDQARQKAVANALATATLYAEAAGVRLGPILSISEYNRSNQGSISTAFATRAGAPVPISGAQTSISSAVTIVWEIDQD
ncbi:MAG: SIMPL domain-containing protein [Pseudomonadota bacterium]